LREETRILELLNETGKSLASKLTVPNQLSSLSEPSAFSVASRHRPASPSITRDCHGGRVPAIALTALARSEDRTRALRAGFLVHVSKPVDSSELVATVASVAGRVGDRS
jgi:CheY-like chemotaxis protein